MIGQDAAASVDQRRIAALQQDVILWCTRRQREARMGSRPRRKARAGLKPISPYGAGGVGQVAGSSSPQCGGPPAVQPLLYWSSV